MNETLQRKIATLPDSPGCYMMKERGKIIYVGKAVNLKNRVRSYFHSGGHTPKVEAMVSHIDDFDILLCRTNLEALILECNLIKLHRPYYNILLKDDKHYPYIRLDLNDPYPKVVMSRRLEKDGARYYGPYIGAGAVKDVLETLRRLFPLRTCNTSFPLKKPVRPCINYEIGRCLGPCGGKCTPEEYRRTVERVQAFLGGSDEEIIDALKAEMNAAAAAYKYERAAVIRDKIRDIEGMMQRQQAIQTRGGEQDVIALACDDMDAIAQVLLIRDGKMVGGDAFELPGEGREEPSEVLFDFVLQYYDSRRPAREVLISDIPEEIRDDLQIWLRERRDGACDLLIPRRGEKKALILMCEKNARDALKKRGARRQIQYERTVGACRDLAGAIGMSAYPRRIEGYDISNTQGQLSVASMVVFIDGEPAKKEYRRYRIKTVEGANDFASLREVLLRRFRRAMSDDPEEKWPLPDLVLIDGGPEQLAFAREAMLSTGADVPMFGLAKKREEIFLPDREDPILLDHHTPALHLIQRVRDESHRYAITFHRSLRGSAAVHSRLEDIPGIGAERRKALVKHFGSVKAVSQASADALAAVKGMTRPAAAAVYAFFHSEDEKTVKDTAEDAVKDTAEDAVKDAVKDTAEDTVKDVADPSILP